MFEAKLRDGIVWKRLIEAIKEILKEGVFECKSDGMHLQTMDPNKMTLVSVFLEANSFDDFKCRSNIDLGLNFDSMLKILKTGAPKDIVTVKSDGKIIAFTFEAINEHRVADFEMSLFHKDYENLEVPDTFYDAVIEMPSIEFQKVMRDMKDFGDTVVILCKKQQIQFSTLGDIANVDITLKGKVVKDKKTKNQKNKNLLDFVGKHGDAPEIEIEREEIKIEDESDIPNYLEIQIGDEIGSATKTKKAAKKIKQEIKEESEDEENEESSGITINLRRNAPLDMNFNLKYLNLFAKASLCENVKLFMKENQPLLVEYKIDIIDETNNVKKLGYLRYYLAPKLESAQDEQ